MISENKFIYALRLADSADVGIEFSKKEARELAGMIDGYLACIAELEAEIAETRCDEIDALNNRIAELEGIIKSDDERLTEAGLRVNLYFGCDTAEIMAEEILSSRARVTELEEQVWGLNLANEKLESAYFADETIAPDGTLKPSVRKLLERIEKAETDYDIAESHVTALLNRIAELEEKQRWIPVSERLPEIEDGDSKDYDVVLTFPFRRDVIVATWSYDALDKTHRRRWFDCSSDEWGSDDITEYVTHWRERPTPPEVQEGSIHGEDVCPKCHGTRLIGYDDCSGADCQDCGYFISEGEMRCRNEC